jgi:hypothetical protein
VFAVHIYEGGAGPAAAAEGEAEEPPYRCPVLDLPCDRYAFVALPACGHVLSERAARGLGGTACPVCAADGRGAVPVLGSEEQVEELRRGLAGRRRKRKRAAQAEADTGAVAEAEAGEGAAGRGQGEGQAAQQAEARRAGASSDPGPSGEEHCV